MVAAASIKELRRRGDSEMDAKAEGRRVVGDAETRLCSDSSGRVYVRSYATPSIHTVVSRDAGARLATAMMVTGER